MKLEDFATVAPLKVFLVRFRYLSLGKVDDEPLPDELARLF